MPMNKSPLAILKSTISITLLFIIAIWDFFESILFIGGLIACVIAPVNWPVKFLYAGLWLIIFFTISKIIIIFESYRKFNKTNKGK
jgi:hypothetical protein